MDSDKYSDDSDSSDEDYVPDSKVEDAVSEVDSDGDPEDQLSGSDSESKPRKKRRIKQVSKQRKKPKIGHEEQEPTKGPSPAPEELQKKKADDLWADFMKDTGFKSKSSNTASTSTIKAKPQSDKPKETPSKTGTVKVTQIFEFAGEEVKVEKEVAACSAEARLLPSTTSKSVTKKAGLGGIGGVLSQLGKKQKISTLEKSKLDWDRFKKEENIEEELQIHNKGKDGYLERQDFLERADLRRFEIEKDLRGVERAKRFNSVV